MKNQIKQFVFSSKKTVLLIVLVCLLSVFIFGVEPARADVLGAVVTVLGWVVYFIAYVIGLILTLIVKVLVDVAQYNDIINVNAVTTGWVIVRDLCNMFFILILLVIAFATILRIESYSAKRLLPKLLIMAVLINFSKTIFGLIIDFSQVIMLTFVNGFATNGEANFVTLFQIDKYLGIKTYQEANAVGNLATAGGILAGLFAMIITLIVMLVMLAVLVMRIIMLWVYTILSPLVFFGAAFPGGQKYTSRIWEDFIKQVIAGPLLAFFIWLALMTAHDSASKFTFEQRVEETKGGKANTELCGGANALFCSSDFQTYIITIALLIGGLMVTQSMGGVAGSAAGKGLQWAKRAPMLVGGGVTGLSAWGARKFAKTKYGFQVNPVEIYQGIKAGLEDTKRKDLMGGERRSKELLEKGGMRGLFGGLGAGRDWTSSYIQGVGNWKGFKEMFVTATHGQRTLKKESKEYQDMEEAFKKEYGNIYSSEGERRKDKTKKEDLIKSLTSDSAGLGVKIYDLQNKGKFDEARKLEEEQTNIDKQLEKSRQDLEEINKKEIKPEKKEAFAKLQAKKERIVKIRPPKGFEGRAAEKTLINEEMKKVADIDNSDELVSYLEDALHKKDKYRAVAIMQKLAKDANENEYLNAFGYDSDAKGLNQFTQDTLVKKLGMSEQQALAVQSDVGYIAERNNHWEVARTVGVDVSGKLRNLIKPAKDERGQVIKDTTGRVVYDDSEHAQAAFAEIMKLDPQVIARALNRLSYGGERPRMDGSGGRDFFITTLGLMLTKALGDSKEFVEKHGGRFNLNAAQNLAEPEVVKILSAKEVKVNPEFIKMTQQKGTSSETGTRIDPYNMYHAIKKASIDLAKKQSETLRRVKTMDEKIDKKKGRESDEEVI